MLIPGVREYCDTDSFQAECPANHVIVMTSARFGRMASGRCIGDELGNMGCSSDALPMLDRLCSGRRVCQFEVFKLVERVPTNCHKELAKYLNADYICTRGKCMELRQETGCL